MNAIAIIVSKSLLENGEDKLFEISRQPFSWLANKILSGRIVTVNNPGV